MKKSLFLFTLLALTFSCKSTQSTTTEAEDKEAIMVVLKTQEAAWNNFDLEGFMAGYWKSPELKFYGSRGVTKGWEQTLANYKKGYPTNEHIGKLRFVINDISKITNGAYSVMGEYHLTRSVGDANGIFMIILKKIDGEWKVIADTSC